MFSLGAPVILLVLSCCGINICSSSGVRTPDDTAVGDGVIRSQR